jgi:heme exporter protein B
MTAFVALLRRDLLLGFRTGGGALLALAFFAGVILFIPLGVGADAKLLSRLAPGMIWVAAALSVLLTLDRLFQADFEDGSLEQFALSKLPLELSVLAKCLANWLTTGLPLTILAPALGVSLGLAETAMPVLVLSLMIGTPALSLMGAVGAALTLSIRRGGLLLSLLVLPLYVPTVIFGAGAVTGATLGIDPSQALMLLGGVTLLTFVLGPLAAAAAVRLNLS